MADKKTDAPDRRAGDDPGITGARPAAFGVRQVRLAINRDEAFRSDQAGAVVDRLAVALGNACDEIDLELAGQAAEPIGHRPRDGLRPAPGLARRHRKLGKYDEVGLVLELRLSRQRGDASEICFDLVTGFHLCHRDPRRLPRRPRLVAVHLEEIAGYRLNVSESSPA